MKINEKLDIPLKTEFVKKLNNAGVGVSLKHTKKKWENAHTSRQFLTYPFGFSSISKTHVVYTGYGL